MLGYVHQWFSTIPTGAKFPPKPTRTTLTRLAASVSLTVALTMAAPTWAMSKSGMALYDSGMVHLHRGDWQQALHQFQAALALDSNDGLLHQVTGYAYSQLNQHTQALNHYRVAYQTNPRDTGTLMSIGHQHEALNQPTQALDAYASVLRKAPNYHFAHLAIGRLQARQQQWPQAIVALEQFVAVYPQHIAAQRLLAQAYQANQQPKKAVEIYHHLRMTFPKEFRDALALARSYNQAEQPQKALQVLQGAVAQLPPGQQPAVDIATEMGHAHLALGQAGFAKNHFEAAFAQAPESPTAQLGLAQTYLKTNNPTGAIPLFQRYLKEFPEDTNTRQYLAQAFMAAKQYPDAAKVWAQLAATTVIQQDPPRLLGVQAQQAVALQRSGELDASIRLYRQLLNQAQPGSQQQRDIMRNLALAYHQQAQYHDAVTMYEQLLANSPDSTATHDLKADAARAHLALADTALGKDDFTMVAHHLGRANTLASLTESVDLSNRFLAKALAMTDTVKKSAGFQAATQYLTVSAQQHPDVASHWLQLANIHGQQQQWGKSSAAYQQVLAQTPNHPEALYGLAVTYDHQQLPVKATEAYRQYLATNHPTYAAVTQQRLAALEAVALQKTVGETIAVKDDAKTNNVSPVESARVPVTEPAMAETNKSAKSTTTVPLKQPVSVTVAGKNPLTINVDVKEVVMPATIEVPASMKLRSLEAVLNEATEAATTAPRYQAVTSETTTP